MASSGGSLEKAFLAKLEKVDSAKGSIFHCQFNPKELKLTNTATWKADPSHATKENPKPFVVYEKNDPGSLACTLIFDTTDEPSGKNVYEKYIQPLQDLLRPQYKVPGALKKDELPRSRPPYCLFGWGSLEFRGVLTSVDVTYLLFKSDGSPLRASVAIKMLEQMDPATSNAVEKGKFEPLKALVSAKTSAVKRTDPSKIEGHSKVISYTAKPGDTVSSIAEETGAAPADIAEANNLDDLTAIEPGTILAIPFGPAAAAAMAVIADIEKTAGKWAEAAAGAAAELAEEALEAVASLFEEEAALAVAGVVFTSAAAATVMAGAGKSGKSKAGGGGAKAGKSKAKGKAKKAEYKRNDKAAEAEEESPKGADFKAKEFDDHESGKGADYKAKEFEAGELSETEAAEAKKAEYKRNDKESKATEKGPAGADYKARESDAPEAGKAGAKGEAKKAEYTRDDKESKATEKGPAGADYKAKETDAPEAGKAGAKGEAKKAEYTRDDKESKAAAEGPKGSKHEAKSNDAPEAGKGKAHEGGKAGEDGAASGSGGGDKGNAKGGAGKDGGGKDGGGKDGGGKSAESGGGKSAESGGGKSAESGGDKAGGDKAGGDKAGGDKAGGDKAGGDKAGGDKAGGDKAGGAKPGEKPGADGGGKSAGAADAGPKAAPAKASPAGSGPAPGKKDTGELLENAAKAQAKELEAKAKVIAKGEVNAAVTGGVTELKEEARETVGVDEHGQKVQSKDDTAKEKGGDSGGQGGGGDIVAELVNEVKDTIEEA